MITREQFKSAYEQGDWDTMINFYDNVTERLREKAEKKVKPTKHIKKLAKKITGWEDPYYVEHLLNNLKEALLNGRYYTGVISVSKSGMSRVIRIGYIKNNHLVIIREPSILKLANCNSEGRIHGCGMDMLFAAQYHLFRTLCPRHKCAMKSYNSLK